MYYNFNSSRMMIHKIFQELLFMAIFIGLMLCSVPNVLSEEYSGNDFVCCTERKLKQKYSKEELSSELLKYISPGYSPQSRSAVKFPIVYSSTVTSIPSLAALSSTRLLL